MRRWRAVTVLAAGCVLALMIALCWSFVAGTPDLTLARKTYGRLDVLEARLLGFEERNHRFPSDDEGLQKIATDAGLTGHGFNLTILDAWGRGFVYRASPSGPPLVYSTGENSQDEKGDGDDIVLKFGDP
jgi:hypothetical protein